ncbi:hypothetical protein U1Q18_050289 [Sarracenia purpurea var. burkii]
MELYETIFTFAISLPIRRYRAAKLKNAVFFMHSHPALRYSTTSLTKWGYFDTGNLIIFFQLQMVRNYKRKVGARSYRNYTDDDVNKALLEIVEGRLSILAASNQFDIPYGHLYNKFHGQNIHPVGHPTALSPTLERHIVQCLTMPKKKDIKVVEELKRGYTEEDLDRAVSATNDGGIPMREASRHYAVPYATLQRRCKEAKESNGLVSFKKPGPKPVLSEGLSGGYYRV